MGMKRAFSYSVTAATDRLYGVGDRVMIWRDEIISNVIGEWFGLIIVKTFDREKEPVFSCEMPGTKCKPFSFTQVKSYFDPDITTNKFVSSISSALQLFRSPKGTGTIRLT